MDGFFNINKPAGMSSAKVVAIVKRQCGKNVKVGHMGTLDPLAMGVLPIAVGRATRLFDLLLNKTKTYRAIFKFGYETDTLDTEGKVTKEGGSLPKLDELTKIARDFVGEMAQMPPIYSSKSVDGVRAYQLAREGKEVSLTPKRITINKLELIKQIDESSFEFEIDCSAGTYVRAIGRDMAYKLSTFCTTQSILRTRSGVFKLENAVELDSLKESDLLPMDCVLGDLNNLLLDGIALNKLLNGVKVNLLKPAGTYKLEGNGRLLGLLEIDDLGNARIVTRLG